MNLRDCLEQCTLSLLRDIAMAHSISLPDPPARAEVVQVLHQALTKPGYLQTFVDQLDAEDQLALAIVAAGDQGQLRGFVLERRLRAGDDEQVEDGHARKIISSLLASGVLYRAFQAVGPDRGEVYILPDELLALWPSRPRAEPSTVEAVDRPREVRRCSSVFSLFAMASFLRRWRQRETRAANGDGQLSALGHETQDLAVELPGRAARERWTLLAHLGLQLGLFTRAETGLQPGTRLPEWLALGEPAERQLWSTYQLAEQWNDLERAGSGGERFVGRRAEPATARAQVLDVMRNLPSDEWILLDDIERLIRQQAPDFLREGYEASASSLVDLESGEVLGGSGSWERVERPLVEYLFSGPLYWLGVVDWGLGQDTWDRVRISATGKGWLHGSDELLSATPAPLKLTEERHVIASERCDLGLLWELEPYLELERRGPPSHYRLARSSFARGLQAGGSVDEVRRLLERAVGGAIPLAFTHALDRWGARAGRFRIRPMVVLTAEDAGELALLLQREELRDLARERLGPEAVAVVPARAVELAELLERLGQLPELDASLRLMAGRRAYSALVDHQTLETLLYCIRLVQGLKLTESVDIPHAERLVQRLEQALGPIAAPRISRQARTAARRVRKELG